MKISKRARRGCALALAALLAVPGLSLIQTRAAGEIEVGRPCSLTVTVDENESDLNHMTIPVSLYKVAAVDNVGNYTAEGTFARMDLSGIDSETTAEEWLAMAEEAAGYAEAAGDDIEPVTQEIQGADGTVSASTRFDRLSTGMYLVAPAQSYNEDYTVRYSFTPYLTALPGNPYAISGGGENGGYGQGADEWTYDVTVGLKPEGERQTGKLDITNILENYNATLGQTSFIFQIEGQGADGERYSNVIDLTYTGAGSQTVTLDKIPAGMTVTVTEIYSGAGYTIVGSDSASALIWSDAAVEAGKADRAAVEFRSRYDIDNSGNQSGYGVTNHFESDGAGGWQWDNPTTPLDN